MYLQTLYDIDMRIRVKLILSFCVEWRTLASVFALMKESGKMQEDEHQRYTIAVQCSKWKLSCPQLMFVKRTTNQNHKVNVCRVETWDENEEADGTKNIDHTMLTAVTNWRAVLWPICLLCCVIPQSNLLLCSCRKRIQSAVCLLSRFTYMYM